MRMRADNQSLPKPMMPIGSRPVLWHVMRYYAHFGHTEFILCLGYGAQAVKDYFLHYQRDGVQRLRADQGRQHVELLGTDISDWTITFIDTGIDTRDRRAAAAGAPATSRTTRCSWPTTATC